MSDRLDGEQAFPASPREIALDGPGLFHLPLCSAEIAVSRHDRIAVVWFHTADGEQRVGVPVPADALRELGMATIDALAKHGSAAEAGE